MFILSLITGLTYGEIGGVLDDHSKFLSDWACRDGRKDLRFSPRLNFDTLNKFETYGVLKAISCLLNTEVMHSKYSKSQLLRGSIHYMLSMCKYEASGVDPLFDMNTEYLLDIGTFLASSQNGKSCRLHYIHEQ